MVNTEKWDWIPPGLIALWILSIVPVTTGPLSPAFSLIPITAMFVVSALLGFAERDLKQRLDSIKSGNTSDSGSTLTTSISTTEEEDEQMTVRWTDGACRSCGREMTSENTDPKGGFFVYKGGATDAKFAPVCDQCSWTFGVLIDNGDVVDDVFGNEYAEE